MARCRVAEYQTNCDVCGIAFKTRHSIRATTCSPECEDLKNVQSAVEKDDEREVLHGAGQQDRVD